MKEAIVSKEVVEQRVFDDLKNNKLVYMVKADDDIHPFLVGSLVELRCGDDTLLARVYKRTTSNNSWRVGDFYTLGRVEEAPELPKRVPSQNGGEGYTELIKSANSLVKTLDRAIEMLTETYINSKK